MSEEIIREQFSEMRRYLDNLVQGNTYELNLKSEPWLNSAQMRAYLSVSKTILRDLINKGLPITKIGGGNRAKASELDKWIKQQQDTS